VASTIKIKRSGVSGKQPNTASLSVGELAINYKDQKLYSSNGTSVFEIGASSGSSGLVSITTATVKNLTQNDTVVTNVGVVAANAYLQVANAVSTYLTKNNPVITGTLTANGSTGTSGHYLRTSGTGVYWSPVSGGGANGFSGILVGANVVSADSTTDRLTLVAGSGITLAANPTTDTITFSSGTNLGVNYAFKFISF
jgi:hypothetical protein